MTSSQLLEAVLAHEIFNALKLNVNPLHVYRAANLAQREILKECGLLEGSASPSLVVGQATYVSTDSGWEFLSKASHILSWGYPDKPHIKTEIVTRADVEQDKFYLGSDGTQPRPPVSMVQSLTDPISVSFFGTPSESDTLSVIYNRVPNSEESISAVTSPILGILHEELLIVGTVYKLLEMKFYGDSDDGRYVSALQHFGTAYKFKKDELISQSLQVQGFSGRVGGRMKA